MAAVVVTALAAVPLGLLVQRAAGLAVAPARFSEPRAALVRQAVGRARAVGLLPNQEKAADLVALPALLGPRARPRTQAQQASRGS